MAELLEVLTEFSQGDRVYGQPRDFEIVPRRYSPSASRYFLKDFLSGWLLLLRVERLQARCENGRIGAFKTIQLELWWILDSMEHWIREFTKELLAWLG
jgi:hypothetical protein